MRRIFGYSAFAVGTLLVFLGPILYLYTKPRVEKAPIDVYDRTVSVGSAKAFSPQVLRLEGPFPAENISIAKSNKAASTKEIALISLFDRTRNVQTGKDFSYGLTIYAMDRTTGEAVRCDCGETPGIRGLTLKFPFGTKKRTYQFYDSTARKPFPARYLRTESLEGLDVYVFQSDVPATRIGTLELPGGLLGADPGLHPTERWYTAVTTLRVEPVTGAIIKAGQISSQWTVFEGRYAVTLAQTNFVNDQESIARTAEQVRSKVYQLRLVELWVPAIGPVLGVLLMAVGLVLLRPLRPVGPTVRQAPVEAVA